MVICDFGSENILVQFLPLEKFHVEPFTSGQFPNSIKQNGRPRLACTIDRKRYIQSFHLEVGLFTQEMLVSIQTQQEYSLHSYLWCFTEALKLEKNDSKLGFLGDSILTSAFVHSWKCPQGHSISKSSQKAFIIKN